jgi:hypothetical protein
MTKVALVATRKGLFKLVADLNSGPSSAKWTIQSTSFLGVPVSMVLASTDRQDWYVALNHGHYGVKLHRSVDKGETWQEISTPTFPESSDESAPSVDLLWSLEYDGKSNTNGLWAGTIPGGLFYSDNSGDSWQLTHALWEREERKQWMGGGYDKPGIHSICVDPSNDAHLTLGVSCGGVWVSRDHGKSWENKAQGMRAAFMPPEKQFDPNIQDPHRLVNCLSEPTVFWVQHHNGIFKSVDDSESWQEIEKVKPSTFGFAVAVHPNNPDIAWFVPGVKDECRIPVNGKFVVTRTRDGGKSFETLSSGLPVSHSYDLVYRHGLDIDASGDQLLMGSTTGNLWISGNQGDEWQCLSNNLPPIYCVRFVA